MDGAAPSDAGDAVIAVPRHPAVAEVNANGLIKATAMEKCRMDNSNIVGTCRTNTTNGITTTMNANSVK